MASKPRKRNSPSQETQRVTSGSTIRIEQPKSSRQSKPNVVTVMAQEINPAAGFINFLRENAVVGVAVGFAIGLQAQVLVKQLVASFIDPLFQLLFGEGIESRSFTLSLWNRSASFAWGDFLYSLLDFIFVLLAIYIIVKFFNLDKLDKPKKK